MGGNVRTHQVIPMDGVIKDFDKHLKSHPRTILSARFGDGKSFFLAAAEKKLRKRYVFLKIYPVNYQVADNQDIFEYIKRDLLFQMYGQGLVPETYEIPDDIAAFFFLKNNWQDFAEEVLKELSCFDASNTIKATLGAAKFLKSMKKKYEEYKKNGGDLGVKLDRFIAAFDNKGIYEADPITAILNDLIKSWKRAHTRKKVCLVFEDMDRIDPAHIFRILNVISAHIDYGYKYGVSPKSSSLAGNKFGVDNIVICLDIDNLKNIFLHFYGQKTCFDGYINKFSDKGIFRYSLREMTRQYYFDELMYVTGMDSKAVQAVMNQFDFTQYTLRQFYHAIDDVGRQIALPTKTAFLIPHRGMFIMAALLRRLGQSTAEILSVLSKAFQKDPMAVGAYMVTSMMLRREIRQKDFEFSFGEEKRGYTVTYVVDDIYPDGQVSLKQLLSSGAIPAGGNCKAEEELAYILGYVSK